LPLDNPVVLALAGRKPLVHRLLEERAVPVPDHECFDLADWRPAEAALARHPLGIVIKPASSYGGKGVTTHIVAPPAIRNAALRASLHDKSLLAEAQIPGECYRVLVYRGTVLSVVRRSGIRVVGDGRATVRELLRACPSLAGLESAEHDPDVVFTLAAQRKALGDVLPAGASLLVRTRPLTDRGASTTDLRTVYDRPPWDRSSSAST
jgi:hypothetical protein